VATAPSDGQRESLRERKKARTRAMIQAQALRLFAAQGYDQTTAEQIAAAAEVSPSTLFRYFATKADIVRFDMLDEMVFDAYARQPADRTPIAALRAAARQMIERLPGQVLAEQLQRVRLIVMVPELRALVMEDSPQVRALFVAAETRRTGRPPDPFAVDVLIAALTGAILVAVESGGNPAADPTSEFTATLDHALGLLEEGLPL
jgi:AcrR family transcriptional regulator